MGNLRTLNTTFFFRVEPQPRLNQVQIKTDGLPLKAGRTEQLLAVFSEGSAKLRKTQKPNILKSHNEPEMHTRSLGRGYFNTGCMLNHWLKSFAKPVVKIGG